MSFVTVTVSIAKVVIEDETMLVSAEVGILGCPGAIRLSSYNRVITSFPRTCYSSCGINLRRERGSSACVDGGIGWYLISKVVYFCSRLLMRICNQIVVDLSIPVIVVTPRVDSIVWYSRMVSTLF